MAGLSATGTMGAGLGVVLGPKPGADGPPRYGVGVGLGATALVGAGTPPIPDWYCAIRLCNSACLAHLTLDFLALCFPYPLRHL